MNKLYLTSFFLLISVVTFAQQTKKVCAKYTYYAPENVTLEQAKRTALERAKIETIADYFGTIITQNNSSTVKNENGQTSISFVSHGMSDVKGEWIETIGEPEYTITYEGNMTIIKVVVNGKIRELKTNQIDISAKILRNGVEDKFEDSDFNSGDELFVSFQSPVDGYLSIYLIDDNQHAYCLLPYQNQTDGIYRIKANQKYVLFSEKEEKNVDKSIVDEYTLTVSHALEHNEIYVIFSPNAFTKALDNSSSDILPRELPADAFHKWLSDRRNKDADLNLRVNEILIKNN